MGEIGDLLKAIKPFQDEIAKLRAEREELLKENERLKLRIRRLNPTVQVVRRAAKAVRTSPRPPYRSEP